MAREQEPQQALVARTRSKGFAAAGWQSQIWPAAVKQAAFRSRCRYGQSVLVCAPFHAIVTAENPAGWPNFWRLEPRFSRPWNLNDGCNPKQALCCSCEALDRSSRPRTVACHATVRKENRARSWYSLLSTVGLMLSAQVAAGALPWWPLQAIVVPFAALLMVRAFIFVP